MFDGTGFLLEPLGNASEAVGSATGELHNSPAVILAEYLINQGIGTRPGTGGLWPLFSTTMPDTAQYKNEAICVYDTPGKKNGRGHRTGKTYQHHGTQVRIRSLDHVSGYTKASAIVTLFEALYRAELLLNGYNYLVLNVNQVGPINVLGLDDKSRRLFTINYLNNIEEYLP